MKTALIGYTGFVGGTINRQSTFDELYNSSNIKEIDGKEFDVVVCAGAPGKKWLANKDPENDKKSIENLITHLKTIKSNKFILISTVDVYPEPRGVDENTEIDISKLSPYGKHRLELELFVREHFPIYTIVRLPGLFGEGLKKNFIFDMIQNQNLELTNKESIFQFYNMSNLWNDIQIAVKNSLKQINFATEPVSVEEVYKFVKEKELQNNSTAQVVEYNIHTEYGSLFGSDSQYLYLKDVILDELKKFITQELSRLKSSQK